ncbi:MAG: class I SAM-dependent methyltransferase [Herpetosiphon sp.]
MPAQLPDQSFQRLDNTPDEQFYITPRIVTHIDDRAIAAVTQLYRTFFPAGGTILDLMSSCISHLPPEIQYSTVVGMGMNLAELEYNPRLHRRIVQNLNTDPTLPFQDGTFAGAAICVSIQYLTQPIAVIRELGRVLRVGAPLVVTFSNRCFPTKAVAIWQSLDDVGHCQLVRHYFEAAGKWSEIQVIDGRPKRSHSDPLYAVVARSAHSGQHQ